jgi:uncharacterized protein YaaW (UPF0174 family)
MKDLIWEVLPPSVLIEIIKYLEFSSYFVANDNTWQHFNELAPLQKEEWVDQNRSLVLNEFCRLGSWSFASDRTYQEVLQGTARKVMTDLPASTDNTQLESAIVAKVWNQAISKMTPAQRAEVQSQIETLAARHGKSVGKEFTGLAALGAAQLSGFGVYLAGTTLLGALNGALGLGLGFGAFAGLSSIISTVIGPVGWAALGLVTVTKLGSPSYKRVLPAIWLIAATRPNITKKTWKSAQKREDEKAEQLTQLIAKILEARKAAAALALNGPN